MTRDVDTMNEDFWLIYVAILQHALMHPEIRAIWWDANRGVGDVYYTWGVMKDVPLNVED